MTQEQVEYFNKLIYIQHGCGMMKECQNLEPDEYGKLTIELEDVSVPCFADLDFNEMTVKTWALW